MIALVVALACEARALIRHYRLRPVATQGFRHYRGEGVALVVSGPGRLAAAAATAHLQGVGATTTPGAAWGFVNVGTAGRGDGAPGEGFVAHRVVDAVTGAIYYPTPLEGPPPPMAGVRTVDRPETQFATTDLYEMEAAGFWVAAGRFATAEVIQVVKVVSDSRTHPACDLTAAAVAHHMEEQLPLIDSVVQRVAARVAILEVCRGDPPGYAAWLGAISFSVSERQQLRRLLQRHALLYPAPPPPPAEGRGRQALAALRRRLAAAPAPLALDPRGTEG
ncbi:MAG: hypothetical protein ACFCBW_07810 [Candidatus Competibacterales bacterium]